MSIADEGAGRIYSAKSARLELIDTLKEQMNAGYQPADRASITRPVLERVVGDLEHAVVLLDALQDERDKNAKSEFSVRDLLQQSRRVRNFSDPEQVFEAIPTHLVEGQPERS